MNNEPIDFFKLSRIFKEKGLNPDVLSEWADGGEVIKVFENDSNICLLVKFEGDQDEYSFQRYFNFKKKTICSVDKNFFIADAPELVARLLNLNYI